MTKTIGIDSGTIYSYVIVWKNDRVEMIANDQDKNRTTPYYALSQIMNSHNIVFDAKRLIGGRLKYWPLMIVEKGGNSTIEVEYKGEKRVFTPEEILYMFLTKMCETSEAYSGSKDESTVTTVPHYTFQCQTTKDSGSIARLIVFHIVNEPTATAIGYGLDKQT
ncbi:heat shock protein 70 family [Circinella umbellata]|nr:heat shock protein 70 family [Circinella umbellata]